MSIPLWCLFIAALLHLISKFPLAGAQAKLEGGYDNSNPRAQQEQFDAEARKALAIHENQIESFPLFAAAVLAATVGGASGSIVDYLAITYIVCRLLYMYCYLKDLATPRTVVWLIHFGAILALLSSPAWT